MYDVDETLVLHFKSDGSTGPNMSYYSEVSDDFGHSQLIKAHSKHVNLLHNHLQRGYQVIVWSKAGWSWAANVVKFLGLEDENIIVMSKPIAYVDDLEASEFMTNRIYLGSSDVK